MLPGKKVDENASGIDLKGLMDMFGGNENGNK